MRVREASEEPVSTWGTGEGGKGYRECEYRHQETMRSQHPKTERTNRTRLIECNVSVFTDAAQEELDTAIRFYTLFVCVTFRDEVLCISIEDVDLGRRDVDCWEIRRVGGTRKRGKG
jgi:hypothetical protein